MSNSKNQTTGQEAGGIKALLESFEHFIDMIDMATVKDIDGIGQVISDSQASWALNSAYRELTKAVETVKRAVIAQTGVHQNLGNGISVTQTPANELSRLIAQITALTAFPTDLWNKLQAEDPGGYHQRYAIGDVILNETLQELNSCHAKLKKLIPAP